MICKICAYEKFNPSIKIHPWETLKDFLKWEKIKQKDIAEKINMTPKQISLIIKGKARITTKTAIKFEKVFWVSAEFWINLQNSYDLDILRNNKKLWVRK